MLQDFVHFVSQMKCGLGDLPGKIDYERYLPLTKVSRLENTSMFFGEILLQRF